MNAQNSNLYNLFLLAQIKTPEPPHKWTSSYLQEVRARFTAIAGKNEERLGSIVHARAMPEIDDLRIGSGKYFEQLAVLFLDICGFSCWPNWLEHEQTQVLRVMNLFMSTMQSVIRDFGGTCEKNTGDGLMAYFSEGNSAEDIARNAVAASTAMFYLNDNVVSPELRQLGLAPVTFRVGIDTGPVTIARVGVHSDAKQFVAIGTTANVACKAMRLVENGGICIGEHTFNKLSPNWQASCRSIGNTSFSYVMGGRPYPAWSVEHRLTTPFTPMPTLYGGLQ